MPTAIVSFYSHPLWRWPNESRLRESEWKFVRTIFTLLIVHLLNPPNFLYQLFPIFSGH